MGTQITRICYTFPEQSCTKHFSPLELHVLNHCVVCRMLFMIWVCFCPNLPFKVDSYSIVHLVKRTLYNKIIFLRSSSEIYLSKASQLKVLLQKDVFTKYYSSILVANSLTRKSCQCPPSQIVQPCTYTPCHVASYPSSSEAQCVKCNVASCQ